MKMNSERKIKSVGRKIIWETWQRQEARYQRSHNVDARKHQWRKIQCGDDYFLLAAFCAVA